MQAVTKDGLNGVVGRVGLLDVLHQIFVALTREFTASARLGVETVARVSRQLPLRVELLRAPGTLEAEAAVVGALVGAQVGFAREGFRTVETFERFLAVVPCQVVSKDVLPLELFAAYWTSELRFGSLVAVFQVHFQLVFGGEGFMALLALPGFIFRAMDSSRVICQSVAAAEALAARFAQEIRDLRVAFQVSL